jgi:type II secretory ATPase GspE/PulE/Tfp pilus assembly ATPase PilB-like protein
MTSIHARDTVEVILRFLDLGVPAFQLASTLQLAVAQHWVADSRTGRRIHLELLQYPPSIDELIRGHASRDELAAVLQPFIISNF